MIGQRMLWYQIIYRKGCKKATYYKWIFNYIQCYVSKCWKILRLYSSSSKHPETSCSSAWFYWQDCTNCRSNHPQTSTYILELCSYACHWYPFWYDSTQGFHCERMAQPEFLMNPWFGNWLMMETGNYRHAHFISLLSFQSLTWRAQPRRSRDQKQHYCHDCPARGHLTWIDLATGRQRTKQVLRLKNVKESGWKQKYIYLYYIIYDILYISYIIYIIYIHRYT